MTSDTQNIPLKNSDNAANACVIVGHSINAITTATVLASLGNEVHIYTDVDLLKATLTTYEFEHQLQALWTLYTSKLGDSRIRIIALPNSAVQFFSIFASEIHMPRLFWLFSPELPLSWQKERFENDEASEIPWIAALNNSNIDRQVPVVLSGISTLGAFAGMAQACRRPWIYYIPFVFLQDGQAYPSMLSPKLWLMGEKTAVSVNKLPEIQPLMTQAKQRFVTDIATTEFARSAIMSMLATRVSFMNEWSRLADTLNVDITQVSKIMGLDTRIGKSYLQAGWGFGGQTLPAELQALQQTIADKQLQQPLMNAVRMINADQKELIFRKFWQYFDGQIKGKKVVIWGASYKPQSGRTTGAAIHELLHLLWSYDITTDVYAMEASEELTRLYANEPLLQLIEHPTAHLQERDALFVLAWSNQADIPINDINTAAIPVFDAQNRLSRSQIESLTGDYMGMGRAK